MARRFANGIAVFSAWIRRALLCAMRFSLRPPFVDDFLHPEYDIDIRGASHSLNFFMMELPDLRISSMSDRTFMKQASREAEASPARCERTKGPRTGGSAGLARGNNA